MISPITYLKETRDEMKKVIWPSRDDVLRLTVIVIIISIVVGLYIGALDFLFTMILDTILSR